MLTSNKFLTLRSRLIDRQLIEWAKGLTIETGDWRQLRIDHRLAIDAVSRFIFAGWPEQQQAVRQLHAVHLCSREVLRLRHKQALARLDRRLHGCPPVDPA